MTPPMSPQEIQELAAGYVLGDLTSPEAEMFTSLLAEMPELRADVASLQAALAMMPYGLDADLPAVELRSQILSTAQAELSSSLPLPRSHLRWRSRPSWAMAALATGMTLMCGLVTLRLSHQMRLMQTQQPFIIATGDIHHTWSGLHQLLQDHRRSLNNPQGPVDFVAQQPGELVGRVKGFQPALASLPLLPPKQGQLLGGSNCQFGDTPGLRLTYQLGSEHTVSAYQLAMADESWLEFQAAQLTLQQANGIGVVLWRDDNYLYALVAEMPTTKLQRLANAMPGV